MILASLDYRNPKRKRGTDDKIPRSRIGLRKATLRVESPDRRGATRRGCDFMLSDTPDGLRRSATEL